MAEDFVLVDEGTAKKIRAYLESISGQSVYTPVVKLSKSTGALLDPLEKVDFDAKFDITHSALRDAILGAPARTLSDLYGTHATETTLAGIKTKTDNLDALLSTRATEPTLAAIKAQTDKLSFDTSNFLKTRTEDFTNQPFYSVDCADVTLATAVGQKSISYIWHPNTITKTYSIYEIWMHMQTSHTAGNWIAKAGFISAENATPGGSTQTILPHNRGSAGSLGTYRYNANAPTRVSGFHRGVRKGAAALTGGLQDAYIRIFSSIESRVEPLTLRAGQTEGLEIYQDIISTLTTAPVVAVGMMWSEE